MNLKHKLTGIVIITFLIIVAFRNLKSSPTETENEIKTVEDAKEATVEKVKISVYYESLCPDSKFFVIYQLLPTYESLSNYLIVDLVPYGKAQTIIVDGKFTFRCQHDEVECFGNKIHACSIRYVTDPLIQLKYIACMITDNIIPEEAGEKCAVELNIDFTPISKCAKSDMGSDLLAEYGERTRYLTPPIRFIPTIELNGSQDIVHQSLILKDLLKSVCKVFHVKPPKCTE